MISCPCCSQSMVIQVRHAGVYWYCPDCRQEMPDLLTIVLNQNGLNQNVLNQKQAQPVLAQTAQVG